MPEPAAPRPLLLCADDFGLGRGIDAGIARLVRDGRLNAFSVLTNGPAWADDAPQVQALRAQAQAGLHLNLTEGRPLSAALARHWPTLPALPHLLLAAHLRRLPLPAVADELRAQWDAFVAHAGVEPDFIDGHQHVHHLPGVRQVMLDWLRDHPLPVRSTARVAGPGGGLKRKVIEHSGGRALARALASNGLRHNGVLLGAYDFQGNYRALMQAWLAQVPPEGALLFCHPGEPAAGDGPDVIAAARRQELAYLGSRDFSTDLAAAGVVLAPIWH